MATRVLIVDDNRILADTLKLILSAAGHDCTVAYSASEAINIVLEFHPNVVVSDFVMPGMDGARFASELHHVNSDIPIIFITGDPGREEVQAQLNQNPSRIAVLGKPFGPKDILRAISELTAAGRSAA